MDPKEARHIAWREPDEDPEVGLDRDTRTMRYAAAKGAVRDAQGREAMRGGGGTRGGGTRGDAWGGSLRRVSDASPAGGREDDVYGRHVPLGYARYVMPGVDPRRYMFVPLAGWRVAVPRAAGLEYAKRLVSVIFRYGPARAGYVRVGDTLVPAALGPGDRATLAESCTSCDFAE